MNFQACQAFRKTANKGRKTLKRKSHVQSETA